MTKEQKSVYLVSITNWGCNFLVACSFLSFRIIDHYVNFFRATQLTQCVCLLGNQVGILFLLFFYQHHPQVDIYNLYMATKHYITKMYFATEPSTPGIFKKDTPRNYKALHYSTFRSKFATSRIIFCFLFLNATPGAPFQVYVHVLDFIALKLRKSLYFKNTRTYFVRACTVSWRV